MNIGTRLKDIRISRKISVYKLSKETDISENHIHSIEKGVSQPSIAMLETILTYFGISMCEFFNHGGEAVYPTALEAELLDAVRTLSEEKAQAVLLLAKLMAQP